MSLSGTIEDLPVLEILQVVAFSQKTGYLSVEADEGPAGVVFQDGRVISGFIWDVPTLKVRPKGIPAKTWDEAVRQRIQSVLDRLVRLREGRFIFNVADLAPSRVGDRDLGTETLEDGINPEALMLDLTRRLDEDRRETSAVLEASLSVPPLPPGEEGHLEELVLDELAEGPRVLLVDDEEEVRRLVGEQLTEAGFDVVEATDAKTARREAGHLAKRQDPFVLVTDLGLPSLGGGNFRGGFEVVEFAASLEGRPPILLMADGADERLRNKARRLGVSVLALKPGLSKLDPLQYEADLKAFGRKLGKDLVPRLQRRAQAGGEDVGAKTAQAPPPTDDQARDDAIRKALGELTHQPEPDVVAFLLLRAARAFLPRAVLFLVKDDELRGLAGFGSTGDGSSLDVVARDLSVSLDAPSPFSAAVSPGDTWTGAPPSNGPTQTLLGRLGAASVNAAAVIPVRAQQETIAVLYGDAPEGQALPVLAPLENVAIQAGRALDEAFLAKRSTNAPA